MKKKYKIIMYLYDAWKIIIFKKNIPVLFSSLKEL